MTTRGTLLRDWRRLAKLSRADIGRMVNTSRQNIDNLENDRVANVPAYLPALAKLMGYQSTDDYLALKPFPSVTPYQLPPATPFWVLQERQAERLAAHDARLPINEDRSAMAHGVSHRTPIIELRKVTQGDLGVETFDEPFEMRIETDELAPLCPAGSYGTFVPGAKPKRDRPVLLRDRAGIFHLRYFQEGALGRWQGVAKVPGFETLDSEMHGLELIAPMVGMTIKWED